MHSPPFDPAVSYGLNVKALASYMSVVQYLSFRQITSFFKEVADIPLSEGTVANLLSRCGKAAENGVEFIKKQIELTPVVGADETGTKINGKSGWFWVFQIQKLTYMTYI